MVRGKFHHQRDVTAQSVPDRWFGADTHLQPSREKLGHHDLTLSRGDCGKTGVVDGTDRFSVEQTSNGKRLIACICASSGVLAGAESTHTFVIR